MSDEINNDLPADEPTAPDNSLPEPEVPESPAEGEPSNALPQDATVPRGGNEPGKAPPSDAY